MQVYTDPGLPSQWVVQDDDGRWWIVPGEAGGWGRKTPYNVPASLHKGRLTLVKNLYAMGIGIPGIEVRSIFGARLQRAREAQGLSVKQLAEKSKLNRTQVHDLEAGRRNPSLELAGKLADALGVSLDDLRPSN